MKRLNSNRLWIARFCMHINTRRCRIPCRTRQRWFSSAWWATKSIFPSQRSGKWSLTLWTSRSAGCASYISTPRSSGVKSVSILHPSSINLNPRFSSFLSFWSCSMRNYQILSVHLSSAGGTTGNQSRWPTCWSTWRVYLSRSAQSPRFLQTCTNRTCSTRSTRPWRQWVK